MIGIFLFFDSVFRSMIRCTGQTGALDRTTHPQISLGIHQQIALLCAMVRQWRHLPSRCHQVARQNLGRLAARG